MSGMMPESIIDALSGETGETIVKRPICKAMAPCLVTGLLAMTAVTRPLTVDAIQDQGCDPKATAANLTLTLPDMNGKPVALSAFAGKVIVLNMWATWCVPCKAEIPSLVELYAKYRSRGLVMLGVSADDPPAKLKPFAAQMKMNYPVLVGDGRDDLMNAYPWLALPTTFIIGRDRAICRMHIGPATKDQIESIVKRLL